MPRRERLRWEKELLGLYLSEHPLGDIESVLPEYVTAYTGDLAEEADQAKVTLGGIIAGSRRIITRAGSTMLVATLEDLTGSTEVVVFPKVFAETANAWTDDAFVLVTGRVDHRDEGSQILCEAVHAWDDAVRMGPVAFGAERDRLLRSRGGRGDRRAATDGRERQWASSAAAAAPPVRRHRRCRCSSERLREPRKRRRPADADPLRAAPTGAGTIQIGFESGIAMDRLLPAIESVTATIRGRPGPLPVVISIPVAGATRQVRLPDRAEWDDRLAEAVRRAAGLPVEVELRPVASRSLSSSAAILALDGHSTTAQTRRRRRASDPSDASTAVKRVRPRPSRRSPTTSWSPSSCGRCAATRTGRWIWRRLPRSWRWIRSASSSPWSGWGGGGWWSCRSSSPGPPAAPR